MSEESDKLKRYKRGGERINFQFLKNILFGIKSGQGIKY